MTYDHSHTHCWNQKTPACGQTLEAHKQCCLCDAPYEENLKSKPHLESWAGEFEKFVAGRAQPIKNYKATVGDFHSWVTPEEIKSFIRGLLEKERAEWEKKEKDGVSIYIFESGVEAERGRIVDMVKEMIGKRLEYIRADKKLNTEFDIALNAILASLTNNEK